MEIAGGAVGVLGVRCLEAVFIGFVAEAHAQARFEDRVAAEGACEAARMGETVIRDAIPGGLILNCGGPEMPGGEHWPLLYLCNDTGNTGFISHRCQQVNHQAIVFEGGGD